MGAISRLRPVAPIVVVCAIIVALVGGCARTVDGQPLSVAQAQSQGGKSGNVDTDQYDKSTLECTILRPDQVASAVGGTSAQQIFSGAICRWFVDGPAPAYVTLNWFEWGTVTVEKDTDKKLGYVTENIKIAAQAAFTARDPKRPGVCGVTTRALSRGIHTFWVEPVGGTAAADPCAAPTALMKLLLNGGQ